jgi:hypothetical protein
VLVEGVPVLTCAEHDGPGPRVEVDRYVVYPTGYDELVHDDKASWCLTVVNGHAYGWRITRGRATDSVLAMNRAGEWVAESRGSGHNKARRWPLEEALRIAARHVDTHRINGMTAVEASAWVAAQQPDAGSGA